MNSIIYGPYGDYHVSVIKGTFTENLSSPSCVEIGFGVKKEIPQTFLISKNDKGLASLRCQRGKEVVCIFVRIGRSDVLYAIFFNPKWELVKSLGDAMETRTFSDKLIRENRPSYILEKKLFPA